MKANKLLALSGLLLATLAPQAGAQLVPITENVRPAIREQVINGVTVEVATVTIMETAPDPENPEKTITIVKTQKEYTIPTEGGASERILEETTITVTPAQDGQVTVTTETSTTTTPISSDGTEGPPTSVPSTGTETVAEEDLELPPTTMAPPDGAGAPPLEVPTPVSGQ